MNNIDIKKKTEMSQELKQKRRNILTFSKEKEKMWDARLKSNSKKRVTRQKERRVPLQLQEAVTKEIRKPSGSRTP